MSLYTGRLLDHVKAVDVRLDVSSSEVERRGVTVTSGGIPGSGLQGNSSGGLADTPMVPPAPTGGKVVRPLGSVAVSGFSPQ